MFCDIIILLIYMGKKEDVPADPEENITKMSQKFNKFCRPFDSQKYEKAFADYYAVLLFSSKKLISSTEPQKSEVFYLHNKTKVKYYRFMPRPSKRSPQEIEDDIQKAGEDEQIWKRACNLSHQLCKKFRQREVCFNQQQIQELSKNIGSFFQGKNASWRGIKKVLKYVVRNMFIYQAFFNQYFQDPEINTETKLKYANELENIRYIYKEQMMNIYKTHPGKIGIFYQRLLKNLHDYPITMQKFFENSFNLTTLQKRPNQYEERISEDSQRRKSEQVLNIKIEDQYQSHVYKVKKEGQYQNPAYEARKEDQYQSPAYQEKYENSQLEESFKELSLQQVEHLRKPFVQDKKDQYKELNQDQEE